MAAREIGGSGLPNGMRRYKAASSKRSESYDPFLPQASPQGAARFILRASAERRAEAVYAAWISSTTLTYFNDFVGSSFIRRVGALLKAGEQTRQLASSGFGGFRLPLVRRRKNLKDLLLHPLLLHCCCLELLIGLELSGLKLRHLALRCFGPLLVMLDLLKQSLVLLPQILHLKP